MVNCHVQVMISSFTWIINKLEHPVTTHPPDNYELALSLLPPHTETFVKILLAVDIFFELVICMDKGTPKWEISSK